METQLEKRYGIGARLLQRMGYTPGEGLGSHGQGIDQPIQVRANRSSGHMGLGMLSQVDKDTHKGEDQDLEVLSSDDSDLEPPIVVSFQKSANKVTKLDLTTRITPENIQLQTINQRLHHLQSKMDDLDKMELHLRKELEILNKVKHSQQISPEIIPQIFQLDNLDIVDRCLTTLLQGKYGKDAIVIDQFDDYIDTIELIMNNLANHNPSQHIEQFSLVKRTIVCHLNFFCTAMIDNKLDLMDLDNFTPVFNDLKRINLIIIEIPELEIILTELLWPPMEANLQNWDILSDIQPNWLNSFTDISIPTLTTKIREIIKSKFIQYCHDWYHRDSLVQSTDLIHTILGDNIFNQLLRDHLLDKILDQVWFKYFDLMYDLTNDNWQGNDSVYALHKIRSCKKLFVPKDFKTIMEVSFNEIFKVIFDWTNFNSQLSCQNWFNWFINEVYYDNLPQDPWEISLIIKAQDLLEKNFKPIHDETLDLTDLLKGNTENDKDLFVISDIKKEYNSETIPLRLVNNTFKDVVEEYCQLQGYNLVKRENKYTQLPYGPQGITLAPIFQISNGKISKNVAIKDDILWVENDTNDQYMPKYLTDFTL